MFQFPAFALSSLCVQLEVTLRWGFPIRTSPDQLLFARSPALIAGCRVLRRLSMPRHPPYTLKSLATFTASPSTTGPPSLLTRKTRRISREQRPRQGVARADDACRSSECTPKPPL